MTSGERLGKAAASFLGVPFALHGRNPAIGLDCVGLLVASLEAVGVQADMPVGYGLKNRGVEKWLICAKHSGLMRAEGPIRTGDVLLTSPGPLQHHILIAETEKSIIHAHAGLRRVVRQPLASSEVIEAHWRLIR